jgi:hypothetical protein
MKVGVASIENTTSPQQQLPRINILPFPLRAHCFSVATLFLDNWLASSIPKGRSM